MLTYERVKSLFDYDAESGRLTWRQSRGRMRAGEEAGCDSGRGYIVLRVDKKMHLAHRVAFLWVHGYLPEEVDHVNGDRSDNRISNLRPSTRSDNSKNASKPKTNKSGVAGVAWRSDFGKWSARIKVNQKTYYLGCFDRKDDAISARKNAEVQFGFHAGHGRESAQPCFSPKRKLGRSGVKGVTRNAGGWTAMAYYKGKRYYVGNFKTIKDAADAHETKMRELTGMKP